MFGATQYGGIGRPTAGVGSGHGRCWRVNRPDCMLTRKAPTMSICANELVAGCDERYWADGKAAAPVLLLDEATEAITEAVHRIRRGAVLEQRDVAATGVALGDLFGGLSQLVELCTTLMDQDARTEPLRIGRLVDRWQTLRIMMLSAQQVTDELGWETAAIPAIRCEEIPVPRHDHIEIRRVSDPPCGRSVVRRTDRCPTERSDWLRPGRPGRSQSVNA